MLKSAEFARVGFNTCIQFQNSLKDEKLPMKFAFSLMFSAVEYIAIGDLVYDI